MKKVLYVGIGGVVGALLRYLIKEKFIDFQFSLLGSILWGTLIVNISGSFILAAFMTLSLSRFKVSEAMRLAVATGLLGAYTTFSTLCRETVNLAYNGFWWTAFTYAAFSVLLGLVAAFLGVYSIERLLNKLN